MNILLLNLPNNGSNAGFRGVFYPLGIGYIAAALKEAGHEVQVYDLQYDKVVGRYGDHRIEEIVRSNHYDVLCAGGVFFSLDSLIALTRISKEIRPEAPIIAGGSFCTSIPEVIFSNVPIDFLIIGEGETTVVHLIQEIDSSKSYGSVPGIVYRDIFGGTVQTATRELELELDTIAFPDRGILPFNGLYRKHFAIPCAKPKPAPPHATWPGTSASSSVPPPTYSITRQSLSGPSFHTAPCRCTRFGCLSGAMI